jgi:hypothetical protein
MEIQHHPKHSKKPRNIKEYLFEFLIIFIAITGSYFAENLREHFVDKHIEKEYMVSMLQDLKADTTSIGNIVQRNNEQLKGLDSLLHVMEDKLVGSKINQFYYFDLRYTLSYNGFNPSNRTISQLKNTGGLRLIKNGAVSDAIVNYDQASNAIINQSELLENQFTKVIDQQTEIIDLLAIRKLHPGSSILYILQQKEHPALLTTSKKTIHAYYFNITMFKGVINSYINKLSQMKTQSSSFIQLIQKEYNLE